ncbi:hypothetical protein Y032_0127g1389 [Ancylostoma ceylanicum]|uniref:Uncharacterized protein n=1 Tax=Ancylostoma ceylanicum TaxID=53326 RepID=A0A016T859_9BILA|nr:hypothetical protein Y032_0127g1389 [Ancylostoma ceylanicum]
MAVDGTRGHAFSTNTVAGPSGHVKETNQETNRDDDVSNLEPFVQFHCAVCKLDEKCFFGDLKASDGL